MHNSQLSTIELSLNVVDPPKPADEGKPSQEKRSVWSRSGHAGRDIQLANGESDKYHFASITHNASVTSLYQQAGLDSIIQRAVEGINVSLLSFGMPQGSGNTDRIESIERTRALALLHRVLRTVIAAPERRERYCAATLVQIDADGIVHPFDEFLAPANEAEPKGAERTEKGGLPFSLWHGDHGIVLPPEIFQEMSCQQDIDHFFTMHRVELPADANVQNESVIYDGSSSVIDEPRHTFPHAHRSTPRESALLFVAEVFQNVSSGHDKRSTITFLYLPQRTGGTITRHLWSSFENLLEHGKLVHSANPGRVKDAPEQHPVSSICQHIVYGGGKCAGLFTIQNDESQIRETLSLFNDMKILRAAKLLMPINYYHMPACAAEAIAQFKQYQKTIKKDMRAAFAAGMHDGWQTGLKSAQRAVSSRKDRMHALTAYYLDKIRDAVLPRFEALAKGYQEECIRRKEVIQAHDEAQATSKEMLEACSQKKAQIDALIEEQSMLTDAIAEVQRFSAEKLQEIDVIEAQKRIHLSEAEEAIAAIQKETGELNNEVARIERERHAIADANERMITEHNEVFDIDYVAELEVRRREKEELLERFLNLQMEATAIRNTPPIEDPDDPLISEIKSHAIRIAEKEQELVAIEAQIDVLERSNPELNAEQQETPAKTEASPNNMGELSRFLSGPSPASAKKPEVSPQKSLEDFFDESTTLSNISMLIEQSPFDPYRLKASDLQGDAAKSLFPESSQKRSIDKPLRGSKPLAGSVGVVKPLKASVSAVVNRLAAKPPAQTKPAPVVQPRPPIRKAPVRIPRALQKNKADDEKREESEGEKESESATESPVVKRLRSSYKAPVPYTVQRLKPLPRSRVSATRRTGRKSKRKSAETKDTPSDASSASVRKSRGKPPKIPRVALAAGPASAPREIAAQKNAQSSVNSQKTVQTSQSRSVQKTVTGATRGKPRTDLSVRKPLSTPRSVLGSVAEKSNSVVSRTRNPRENQRKTPTPTPSVVRTSQSVKKLPGRRSIGKQRVSSSVTSASRSRAPTQPPKPDKPVEEPKKAPSRRSSDKPKLSTRTSEEIPKPSAEEEPSSTGVVVVRKSAKKSVLPTDSMFAESGSHSSKQSAASNKGGRPSRKLVQPDETEASPGKIGGNIGTIIRNFIAGSASAFKKTVSPRRLEFEKSNDMFSFLHEASASMEQTSKSAPERKSAPRPSKKRAKKSKRSK